MTKLYDCMPGHCGPCTGLNRHCVTSVNAGALDITRSTLCFAEHARRVSQTPTVNVMVSAAAELRRLRAVNADLQAQLVGT